MNRSFIPSRTIILMAFIGLYVGIGAYVLFVQSITSNFGSLDPRFTIQKLIDGTADRPFVYRLLVPQITGALIYATPDWLIQIVNSKLNNLDLAAFIQRANSNRTHEIFEHPAELYTHFALIVVIGLFLAGFVFTQYKLTRFLYPQSWAMALFSPIIGLLIIPALKFPQISVYDISVVFFAAICAYYMVQKQWWRYLLFFFVATLNKETSIFLIPLFFVNFVTRLPLRLFIRLLIAQIAIYGATKYSINYIYRNNPGYPLENYFDSHVDAFMRVLEHYQYQELGTMFSIVFLLVYRWREKPVFVRNVLTIFPMIYIAYFWYGFPQEYRCFYDLVPLVSILITDTLIIGTGVAESSWFHHPNNVKEYITCPPQKSDHAG